MATTYPVQIKNFDSSEIELEGNLGYTGSASAIPATLNQVSPKGTIVSGALPTVQLVTGTGAQVSTTRDVETYTTVTYDATNNVGSCTVALSADDSTYSTVGVLSIAAAVNNTGAIAEVLTVRVPAAWYIKVTLVHCTVGVSTYA